MTAIYYYDIPVIVTDYGADWNQEENVPVVPEIIARIVTDFNDGQLAQYSRDVKITKLSALLIDSIGAGKIRVKAEAPGVFSRTKAEKIRQFLSGQCSDGWGENGFEIGRSMIAHVWDREHDVQIVAGE